MGGAGADRSEPCCQNGANHHDERAFQNRRPAAAGRYFCQAMAGSPEAGVSFYQAAGVGTCGLTRGQTMPLHSETRDTGHASEGI